MGATVFQGVRLLLSGALCLLASLPALAESPPLSLPQAIQVTLNNNPELKSLREEKGILDAGTTRARLFPNPTLEVEAGTGALTGSSAENSLSVGVAQEFLLGDKRQKRRAVAEGELASFRWQLAERERELREQVQGAYYDSLLAKERLGLADRLIALNRQLLEVADDRLAAGDIPELEMYLVKLELARSAGTRLEMERAFLDSRSRLFSLMALPSGGAPQLAGALEGGAPLAKSLADLKQLALSSRPDLKALEASKGKGDAEVALAEAEAVPNLTAGLALTRERTAMEIGGVEGRDTAYTIGVKLSMPIPVFDRNQAGLQEARAKRKSAEVRSASAAAKVEREVEQAYASLVNAEKVRSLYQETILRQLEENLTLTREAYRLGEVGILAVIQEQKKFFEVSDGYLTALHARQMALAKLESAVAADLNGGVQ